MGTIEDKLSYLAKTKKDIMNALKSKGVEIDESVPFSEYDVMIKSIRGGDILLCKNMEELEAKGKLSLGILVIIYDKETDTLEGIYEVTENGLQVLPTQLTADDTNVAPGKKAFGPKGIVEGTFTSDATATANDMLNPKTAYVNGQKIIGTMFNRGAQIIKPLANGITIILPGYHNGGGYVEQVTSSIDPNIIPENIREGTTILNTTGTLKEGIDTSDADATAEEIISPKTAYVNGEKITGTMMAVGHSILNYDSTSSYDTAIIVTAHPSGSHYRAFNNSTQCNITVPQSKVADAINLTSDQIIKGATVLGIAGTATSDGIKQFDTEKEMQADPTAKEGDLAVIYSQDTASMTATIETQTITFPQTVVLPEAFTDFIYAMFRAVDDSVMFDAQVMLESTMFNFDAYTESGSIQVQYESSDGITYTRIDGGDETIDCGTPIKCYREEEWNDVLGYFMKAQSMYFGGIFEYTTNHRIDAISLPDLTTAEIDYSNDSAPFQFNNIIPVQIPIDKLSQVKLPTGYSFGVIYIDTNYNIKLIACPDSSARYDRILVDTNNNYLGICTYGTDTSKIIKRYTLDIDTVELTDEEQLSPLLLDGFNGSYIPIDNIKSIPFSINAGNVSDYTLGLMQVNQTMWKYANIDLCIYITAYIPAQNQFTLNNSNQLLPGKVGYGSNGIITGDDSVYENIVNVGNIDNLIANIFNITDIKNLDISIVNILTKSATIHKTLRLCISDKTKDTSEYLLVGNELTEHESIDFSGETSLGSSSLSSSIDSCFKIYHGRSNILVCGMVNNEHFINVLSYTSPYTANSPFKHNNKYYLLEYADRTGYNLYIQDISTVGTKTTKYTIDPTSGKRTLGIGYFNGYVYYYTASHNASTKTIDIYRINMDTGNKETVYTNTTVHWCPRIKMTMIDNDCYIRFFDHNNYNFICIKVLSDNTYSSKEYSGTTTYDDTNMLKYNNEVYMSTTSKLYKLNDVNNTLTEISTLSSFMKDCPVHQIGDILWDSKYYHIININDFMNDPSNYTRLPSTNISTRLICTYTGTKALYYTGFNEGSPIKCYSADISFAYSAKDNPANLVLFSNAPEKFTPIDKSTEMLGYLYKKLN